MDLFTQRRRTRFDILSILLVPGAVGLVLLSQAFDGIPLSSLLQWQAAVIVLGGTTAAVMISYTPEELWKSLRAAGATFKADHEDPDGLATALLALSIRAHKRGALTLESDAERITDPFLREGLELAIDGSSLETVRELLSVESRNRSDADEAPARVFEAAAGYAPTLGILGAVLGLVQVMQNLNSPAALGPGIATAFVATVYGVGVANLLLLPIAGRLRERAAMAARRRDMMTHAVCAIALRTNPRLVAQTLRAYSTHMARIEDISRLTPGANSRMPTA